MASEISNGSRAPSIEMLAWMRGNPLSAFQRGGIYVVECFRTTCIHCPKALSDLGQLQEKYGDLGVEVFAVAVNERAATADEARAQVDTWLNKEVPNSKISIAVDSTGKMDEQWMIASSSFGVPQAFVIDRDGNIAFIGHPASLESVLPKVIDGSWGTSEEAKQADKERLAEGEIYALEKALWNPIITAMKVEDWKTALSATEEAINVSPDDPDFRELQAKILIDHMHDFEAGWTALGRFAREAIERNCEDWLLAVMQQLFGSQYDYSRLPFAERFSMGKELSDCILRLCAQQDAISCAMWYETVAPYYHESGDNGRALELIEQAIALAEGESLPDDEKQEWLAQLQQALEKYSG